MTSNLPEWLIAVIAIVYPGIQDPGPNVFNGYLEADYVYLAPADPGRIASISVEEGKRVFEGQQVFALDASRQISTLAAAEARVRVAAANLDNLQTGSRSQEVDVIRAELARAQAQRDLAEATLARSQQLFSTGAVSSAKVDTDTTALASNEAQVAELTARLEVAELPARDAQRIAAEATLQAAEADAATAREALNDRTVLTTVTGLVDKLFFEPGEVAGAGTPIVSMLPDDSLYAVFFVPEASRSGLGIGDALQLTCDGCGGPITATVTRIASSPQYTPPIIYSQEERSRLVFRAEAHIADAPGLVPGQPITLEMTE